MRSIRSALARGAFPLSLLLFVTGPARGDARVVVEHGEGVRVATALAKATRGGDVAARGARIVSTLAKVDPSTLVRTGVDRFGDGETVVRYAQRHGGLPVIGRGASVRFSASGDALATVLDLESDLPVDGVPRVVAADAAKVASARTRFSATERDARLVVWPTLDRGVRLAWVVLPPVPAGVPTMPRAIVDAGTGEILQVRDLVTFAKANTYTSNPTSTPGVALLDLPIAPEGGVLSNPFLSSMSCIDRKTVKDVSFGGFGLKVHVCDLVQTASPDGNGDYVYDPADEPGSAAARTDSFSEVSMYYHASKGYAFFRALQGDPDAQVVADKPLRLIANLQVPKGMSSGDFSQAADPDLPLDPFQNAFFAPAAGGLGSLFQQLYGFEAGALWFGQGPLRDYSYDGDVVYHELTHAVVDATLKLEAWHVDARGAIDAPGAMNEGLADYFSSAITGDPKVGEYASADILGVDGGAIRSLDNQDRCEDLVGEVHVDSTAFSGALWGARTSLPEGDRPKFDAALYKAMRSSPGSANLGFEDLAKIFQATLATDLPAGAAALEAKMTERGLLPACERIFEAEAGVARGSADPRFGFVAPGKQTVGMKSIAPGIVQLKGQLPENAATLKVSFTSRSGGAVGPLGGGKPFTPVVLAKVGAPITWDPKSKTGHDAPFAKEAKDDAVELELPEGTPAGPIYVQIANAGDTDGAYDRITLAFTTRSVTSEPEPTTLEPAPAPLADADSGCTATPKGSSATVGAGLLALAAALGVVRRRRRS